MRKPEATLGAAAFFVVAPGVVAGAIPWLLTDWRPAGSVWAPLRGLGFALVAAGAVVLVVAFTRFVTEGSGTPAPIAPTEVLVVGGLYRHVRNPMYLAVVAVIVGEALILGRPVLLAYAGAVWAVVAAFVRGYEEPTLARTFGASYEEYCRAVPAWRPRLRAWRPDR
jgi:protein-S-isoprenylcysteine O-methyltransferase Ste14